MKADLGQITAHAQKCFSVSKVGYPYVLVVTARFSNWSVMYALVKKMCEQSLLIGCVAIVFHQKMRTDKDQDHWATDGMAER